MYSSDLTVHIIASNYFLMQWPVTFCIRVRRRFAEMIIVISSHSDDRRTKDLCLNRNTNQVSSMQNSGTLTSLRAGRRMESSDLRDFFFTLKYHRYLHQDFNSTISLKAISESSFRNRHIYFLHY